MIAFPCEDSMIAAAKDGEANPLIAHEHPSSTERVWPHLDQHLTRKDSVAPAFLDDTEERPSHESDMKVRIPGEPTSFPLRPSTACGHPRNLTGNSGFGNGRNASARRPQSAGAVRYRRDPARHWTAAGLQRRSEERSSKQLSYSRKGNSATSKAHRALGQGKTGWGRREGHHIVSQGFPVARRACCRRHRCDEEYGGERQQEDQVEAAWSYEANHERFGNDGFGGGGDRPRRILVKVPCVMPNGTEKRGPNVGYKLAWNGDVADSNSGANNVDDAVKVAAGGTGSASGDQRAPEARDSEGLASATRTSCGTRGDPYGGNAPSVLARHPHNGVTAVVQLPRPFTQHDSPSTNDQSICPNGRDIHSSDALSRCSLSASLQQSLVAESQPHTSRVIERLRASVTRDTSIPNANKRSVSMSTSSFLHRDESSVRRGLLANSFNPATLPVTEGGMNQSRAISLRPQSAVAVATARTWRLCVGPDSEVATGGHAAKGTATTAIGGGGAVGNVSRFPLGRCVGARRANGTRVNQKRPESAMTSDHGGSETGNSSISGNSGRRRSQVRARADYSFYPTSAKNILTCAGGPEDAHRRHDHGTPVASNIGSFGGGETRSTVAEWESSGDSDSGSEGEVGFWAA